MSAHRGTFDWGAAFYFRVIRTTVMFLTISSVSVYSNPIENKIQNKQIWSIFSDSIEMMMDSYKRSTNLKAQSLWSYTRIIQKRIQISFLLYIVLISSCNQLNTDSLLLFFRLKLESKFFKTIKIWGFSTHKVFF